MNRSFLILLVSIFLISTVISQDSPKQILESGDVEHFIKTFPLLEKDFEKYGLKYEARKGNVTVPEGLKAHNEFLGILKKHGWDKFFYQKFGAIMMAYSYIVYGREMKKADPEFEKSIKEIDSNPNLSAELKKQLKDQMLLVKKTLKNQESTFKESLHPNDLNFVKPHVKEIERVIEKKNK